MNEHVHTHEKLTKNQSLVMGTLEKAGGPLSAYTILDELRTEGLRAPLQVYRALEKLVEFGLAHRLESLNAFVACRHTGCGGHKTIAFMICEKCGHVREISDSALAGQLQSLAEQDQFAMKTSTVELRGICVEC
ncbi:MAG: Fur family transcriptional regulator [Pseudomonadota bacterium]